jgi:signal transduction histidine kinase
MAISKWIVEAHGGSIDAKSKRGQGTTMTVRLPIEDEA